jgi:hypothetical protein
MKRFIVVGLIACGGGKGPKQPVAGDDCSAANKVAVEHGVELETNENSPLYGTLSDADVDCARRAVRSTAPLYAGAPQCLVDGRAITAWMAALAADTAELPAEAARNAFVAEVKAVPDEQRASYVLDALDRAYDCGNTLALDEDLWSFLAEPESAIEACKCKLDRPRLELIAWYFHAGGGDWAATVAERRGP